MKKVSITVISLLIVVAIGMFFSQGEKKTAQGLWEDATYTEDITLGSGKNSFNLKVAASDKSITFTVKTDKTTVGEALKEVKLIEGKESEFGIYIKKVNGILADYDIDQSYWSFEQNGEAMLTGVDAAEFKNGETFELVYTK